MVEVRVSAARPEAAAPLGFDFNFFMSYHAGTRRVCESRGFIP